MPTAILTSLHLLLQAYSSVYQLFGPIPMQLVPPLLYWQLKPRNLKQWLYVHMLYILYMVEARIPRLIHNNLTLPHHIPSFTCRDLSNNMLTGILEDLTAIISQLVSL